MTHGLACALILATLLPAQNEPPVDTELPPAVAPGAAPAVDRAFLSESISVELRAPRTTIEAGAEVVVEFVAVNRTSEPVTLFVPGVVPGKEKYLGMGLPLEHVYSAANFRGLEIATDTNPAMGDRDMRKPEKPVPPVTIAPFGTIGLRYDISRHHPGMRQPGVYHLRWRPYGGAAESNTLTLRIVPQRRVTVETDMGTMQFRLFYDRAPRTVENFVDLVNRKFYNGKTFHEVRRNLCIMGGCPIGDGTGKRPDGITIDAEFSNTPFEAGTVAMSLAEPDENSASCQFFICLSRQPKWDGHYTAFAQVDGPDSIATLRRIADTPTDADGRPTKPIRIKTITISDAAGIAVAAP